MTDQAEMIRQVSARASEIFTGRWEVWMTVGRNTALGCSPLEAIEAGRGHEVLALLDVIEDRLRSRP